MRKLWITLFLLSGFSLVGCSYTNLGTASNQNEVTMTEEEAKELAIKEAGGGQIIEFSYDEKELIPTYEITVINDTTEYEFEISAVDGRLLKKEMKSHPNQSQTSLDEAQIKEIVLNQVNGTIAKLKLVHDNNLSFYKVVMVDDQYKYELKILATDGTILNQEKEVIDKTLNNDLTGLAIDKAQAKDIALTSTNGGVITEISLDYDHSTPIYEITVCKDGTEYDFEINGVNGVILEMEMK
ncbi:MAG: PepSY domain-containing protein [Turicibacter sp.]|nr:PepSY domain-containing protein [Turicibacter sp.]